MENHVETMCGGEVPLHNWNLSTPLAAMEVALALDFTKAQPDVVWSKSSLRTA